MSRKPLLRSVPKRPYPFQHDGFTFRVVRGPNENGDWYWRALKRIDGREKTFHAFWAPPFPDNVISAYQNLSEESDNVPASGVPVTLEDLVNRWFSFKSPTCKSEHTRRSYRDRVKTISSFVADIRISHVTATEMDLLVSKLREAGYSDASITAYLRTLGYAWKYGTRKGWVSSLLPLEGIKKPTGKLEKYTPSDAEMDKLYRALPNGWRRTFFLVAKYTGARIDEIATLSWSRIVLSENRITLTGKTGSRTIKAVPKLRATLETWKTKTGEKEPNIWGKSEQTLHEFNLHLRNAANKAGIEHRITNHSIRRWFIDRMRRKGIDVKTAASITGHSVEVMLAIYSTTSQDEISDAMDKLDF